MPSQYLTEAQSTAEYLAYREQAQERGERLAKAYWKLDEGEKSVSMNKIILLGNLGRDPELRFSPQGTAICDFSVATASKSKDGAGDSIEVTTWFRVTFFGKQAEVASKFLAKGRQVYVEGRLSQRDWTDRDGNKRTSLEVQGTDLHFIGAKPEGQSTPVDTKQKPIEDEDLPF